MANIDQANGFTLSDSVVSEESVGLQSYSVDASNTPSIFKKDPVMQEADGYYAQATDGIGIAMAGVAVGFLDANGLALSYLPASTAGTILSVPVKGHIFEVQASTGVALTVACVGATADFVRTAGSTVSGISKYELDSSNVGTGQQMRILGKVERPGNEWGEHVKLRVMFVENLYESNTSV